MKKVRVLAGLILCFAMIFAMVGCGEQKNPEKEENILCGIMKDVYKRQSLFRCEAAE